MRIFDWLQSFKSGNVKSWKPKRRGQTRSPVSNRLAPCIERFERRDMLAADLLGLDGRLYGEPSDYFNVVPSTLAWGDSATVNLFVANFGDTASGTFQSRVYLSKDTTIDATNDTLLRTINFPSIIAMSGNTFSYAGGAIGITLPASDTVGPSGSYYIGMIIDWSNLVVETNETNNNSQAVGSDTAIVSMLPPVAVVTDSSGASTDHTINFGSIVNDGAGNSQTVQSVTLSDSAARSLLKVPLNGIHLLNGTNFHITSILSNKRSQAVNVAGGTSLIAANSSETWTIQVSFDPTVNGSITDTLQIQTDDPVNPTINIVLNGTGTPLANLRVVDSVGLSNDQMVNFGDVGVDGANGTFGEATVTLTNNGSGSLAVNQNGISLPAGPFSIVGIVSNLQGAINLATGSKTIAAGNTETWTISLRFDPTATGLFQVPLTITSDDQDSPSVAVSLLGTGKTLPHLVVTDSVAAPGDLAMAFGSIHADGAGKQLATQTVTLTNSGQMPLQIDQNGITLDNGTQYKITSIISSTQGILNLSGGEKSIAASSSETWTVTLEFDPATAGALSDTLRIVSNDTASPATVSLSGTGLNQAALVVTDSDSPNNDLSQSFGATLNDGANGRTSLRTLLLTNIGIQPLVVSQNGISVLGGTNYQIVSVVSSASGAVDLASGSATIAASDSETWTVTVAFDPRSTASLTDTLRIISNDPVTPNLNVSLSGQGVVPVVTAVFPTEEIHVSAGSPYRITWNGSYAPGTSTFGIYYDTDQNPANGFVAIVTALPQSKSFYDWQVPTGLVGGEYSIYVRMEDGSVSAGSYAAGNLIVDPSGSDRLLSTPVTDQAAYTLSYVYEGTIYNVDYTLAMGENTLYTTAEGATLEYHVTRAITLVDTDHTTYDELGNVTSTTDANGQTTTFQYDQLSRVTHIAYPDGGKVDYTYDPANNLLSMLDATGWQLYGYDARNRLTSVTYSPTNSVSDPAALTIGYEYDLASRLTALIYPSGKRVEYGYDNDGKLTSVREKNAGQPDLVTTYLYSTTTGLLTTTTRPNDTQTVNTYDENGQLVDILHRRTSTSALILQYHYTVDAAGRRTQVVVTTPTGVRAEAYVYDDFNRLSQVTYSDDNGTIDPTDKVVKYTYDLNGNRLTQTTYNNGVGAGATETLTYAYGFENRLLSITDQNGVVQARYAYDWRGNQVLKATPIATTVYGYDSRNLLVTVDDGMNQVEYEYDGADRRVAQFVNGVRTQFVIDLSRTVYQAIEERSGGGLVADYAFGLERVSGRLSGQGEHTFYLMDGLHSTVGLADISGLSLGTYSYDAFGIPRTQPSVTTNTYLFAGERFEKLLGIIDLRSRSYDPTRGIFLQKDPLGYVDSVSTFQYVGANPINSIDPLGTFSVSETIGDALLAARDAAGVVKDALVKEVNDYLESTYEKGTRYRGPNGETGPEWTAANAYIDMKHYNTAQMTTHFLGGGVAGFALTQALGGFWESEQQGTAYDASAFRTNDLRSNWEGARSGVLGGSIFIPSYDNVSAFMNEVGSWFGETNKSSGSVSNNIPLFSDNKYLPFFPPPPPPGGNVGGVLINQAATLIGANINDITGATFDPLSRQLVFLGSSNPSTLHDVNLDLFTTAIQSVYGSAVPPYVTLDPPAKLLQQSFNLGDGDGVILNGKTAAFPIKYTPFTPIGTDDMTLSFNVNGTPVTARIDAQVLDGTNGNGTVTAGGRYVVILKLGAVTGLPSGVTLTQPTFPLTINGTLTAGTITLIGGGGYTLIANAQGQDSNFYFTLNNSSGAATSITNLKLVTDLQHRKLGGRTENTRLGWIMQEADRVMKALAGGKDHLTGAIYDSNNPSLPAGFQNTLERYVANNQSGSFSNRFWFTPNQETLKQYIDPVTGEATVVFDESSVKLNTEALILGQPEDVTARAFADYFNAHYDELALVSFPVYDPSDPTGTAVINVKIFEELRDAMKAVAIARFFHDNNIPLDTWWLNSWTPPVAYAPATIPTLSNSLSNGSVTVTFHGGVQIKTPNTYLPDAVAKSISDAVKAQRANVSGDLGVQSWSVDTSTSVGTLNAVAASLDAQKQDANVTLGSVDLSFASPGGRQLTFDRYYNSGYLGNTTLGMGWQVTPFDLQFQLPTYVDDAGLMRDSNGNKLTVTGATSDTLLRSGEIRLMNHATGQPLNFFSSLTTAYDLDSQGNPILGTSGLTASGVPTFSPGQYQDGSTLTQNSSNKNYTLTRTDGSTIVFDAQGNLLTTTSSMGYTITYGYANGKLSQITDTAGQKLTITYGTNGRIQYVTGPESSGNASRRVAYTYDPSGTLTKVEIQALQSGGTYTTARSTQYLYNANNQLTGVIGPDGLTKLTNTPDVRGRSDQSQDVMGNMIDNQFALDASTGNRTTQTIDMGTTGVNNPTTHGIDALKYFAAGSTSMTGFDSTARTTQSVDTFGNATQYGYTGSSLLPNSVTLPTPDRATISIQRNAANLPTVINDPANVGGTPVQISYNSANLPTEITDSKGIITKYTYTAWNALATVTVAFGTPLAATTTNNYNVRKLLQSVVDPLGHTVVSYTYDSLDRVKTVTNGAGLTTTYDYDAIGRLKRVYDPRLTGATNFLEYTYNDNDQVTQLATPTGNITYVYDNTTHRLTSITDLTGNTTQFAYDPATGLQTSVTQVSSGGNAVTQAVYDRRGTLTLIIAPEGTRTVFRTDALGRQTDVIEDDGQTPTGTLTSLVSSATTMTVNVSVSEPTLVASLKYWRFGQPESTASTVAGRLADLESFAFDLSGLDTSQPYHYQLSMTDRVGKSVVDYLPEFTSGTSVNVTENTTSVLTVTAADQDGGTLSFSIVGGVDATKFIIDTSTGALSFKTAPNYENSADSGGDNVYEVQVQVNDGSGGISLQTVSIHVTDVNEFDPILANATFDIPENSANGTAVGTVTGTDADATKTFEYSIAAGNNLGIFVINPTTGAILVVNNTNLNRATVTSVVLTIQVSDGGPGSARTSTALVTINVTDITAPAATSFVRQSPSTSPTISNTLVFRATFSESVTNIDVADFVVSGTTATVTGISEVSGSNGMQYDISVAGGNLPSLIGTVGLNLAAGQNIRDVAGNALPTSEPGTDETYSLDNDFQLASLTPTSTGFVAEFNSPISIASLNLYDQGGLLGAADVLLVGDNGGEVRGSLVVDPGLLRVTFIQTLGTLAPDNYTVSIRSGANAFHSSLGQPLDGNGDGTPGDDFVQSFVVAAPAANAVTVRLPNFARGYGQPVNLPANVETAGLPLTLSTGSGLSNLSLELDFDPTLLDLSAFALSSDVAARGGTAQLTFQSAGRALLTVDSTGTFAAAVGSFVLGSFTARVPDDAAYGGKQILDITNLHVFENGSSLNEVPSIDVDAIHVAAYFGDTNGSRTHNSPDTTLIRRIIGQVNTGFSAYPLADPVLLADITLNGAIQSADTTSIRRVIGQVPVANVPALPTGLTPPPNAGADPRIFIPQTLTASPGGTVTVPVKIEVTEPAGITISGFQIAVEFDSTKFTIASAQLGSLFAGTDLSGTFSQPVPGKLIFSADSSVGSGHFDLGTIGDLFTVTLAVKSDAAFGGSTLNLLAASGTTVTELFDNALANLILIPAPTNSAEDTVDGLITIAPPITAANVSAMTHSSNARYEANVWSTSLSSQIVTLGLSQAAGQILFDLAGTASPAEPPTNDEFFMADNTAPIVMTDRLRIERLNSPVRTAAQTAKAVSQNLYFAPENLIGGPWGTNAGSTIMIGSNAAGYAWLVGTTPNSDTTPPVDSSRTQLSSKHIRRAADKVDLLIVDTANLFFNPLTGGTRHPTEDNVSPIQTGKMNSRRSPLGRGRQNN